MEFLATGLVISPPAPPWILLLFGDSNDENGVETSVDAWESTGVEEGDGPLAPAPAPGFEEGVGGLSEREFDLCMCTNLGLKIGGGGKNAENVFPSCSVAPAVVVAEVLLFMWTLATAAGSCLFMLFVWTREKYDAWASVRAAR